MIKFEELELQKVIGEGSFGKYAWEGNKSDDGMLVSVSTSLTWNGVTCDVTIWVSEWDIHVVSYNIMCIAPHEEEREQERRREDRRGGEEKRERKTER